MIPGDIGGVMKEAKRKQREKRKFRRANKRDVRVIFVGWDQEEDERENR